MKLEAFLVEVNNLAKQHGISTPYLVGGVPRDRILKRIGAKGLREVSEIRDIDISTGDIDSAKLSKIIAQKYPEAVYREYDDGHTSIDVFGIHMDFSGHFVIPGIEDVLAKQGVLTPTPMDKELYSRDFTMNTILEKLDFSGVFDVTKKGLGDIHAGLIRCPIDPDVTIGIDPRRILRAIKFAVKFDFRIESGLRDAMMKYHDQVALLPPKFISSKIDEIVLLDADKGIDLLIEFKLLSSVQLSKMVYDILIQKRKVINAL
jgi:tRNA nucleotidyltransferase/poly(A) polymerase